MGHNAVIAAAVLIEGRWLSYVTCEVSSVDFGVLDKILDQ